MLCQSDCARLHKTVNMVVFFTLNHENTYHIWKEGITVLTCLCLIKSFTVKTNNTKCLYIIGSDTCYTYHCEQPSYCTILGQTIVNTSAVIHFKKSLTKLEKVGVLNNNGVTQISTCTVIKQDGWREQITECYYIKKLIQHNKDKLSIYTVEPCMFVGMNLSKLYSQACL